MSTHRFDWLSFLFGGLFLVAGIVLVTDTRLGIRMEWALPAAIIVVGLAVLFAALPRRGSRERHADET